MKILDASLAAVFVLFAAVQYNDPDAFLWIIIYLTTALVSVLSFFNYRNKMMIQLLLFGSFIGLFYLLPEFITTLQNYNPDLPTDPTITHTANTQTENFKEFFGLFICFLLFVFQYSRILKQEKNE